VLNKIQAARRLIRKIRTMSFEFGAQRITGTNGSHSRKHSAANTAKTTAT
jgi:hypothetical protein